ncbi:MAG: ParB N-terminal domain-containing protein [Xenococcus sp. MO_188.B8]|nr:ParB N-terminal domain-containing protein [Xenococcus sp. MO_188.B8]
MPAKRKTAKKEASDLNVDNYLFENNSEDTVAGSKTVSLEDIQLREDNTRPLNSDHILELAESIKILGLLQPIVIDIKSRLLAGGHRLAALEYLKETSPQEFEQMFPNDFIPIREMPFDVMEQPELALQVEVAENEKRRDYTPQEVKHLAQKLKEAGYTDSPHRPKKGEKALVPALKIIIGKSRRSIMRYLSTDDGGEKSVPPVILTPEAKTLQRIEKDLLKLKQIFSREESTSEEQKLLKKIPAFLKALEAVKKKL